MDFNLTLIIMAAAAGVFALAFWQDHRPKRDTGRVRWIPWRFMLLVCGAVILFGLVNLLNLAGFKTGPRPPAN